MLHQSTYTHALGNIIWEARNMDYFRKIFKLYICNFDSKFNSNDLI